MRPGYLAALFTSFLLVAGSALAEDGTYDQARNFLIEQIVDHARMAEELTGHGEIDMRVLEAIRETPRHRFVAEEAARMAYFDMPLPAEHGLRESQPYIVALMTDLVGADEDSDVLILGMGGGYHAAVASRLARNVFSLDLDAQAASSGMALLNELDVDNVEARVADPYYGWPDRQRSFDAIIIRLAVDSVPPAVLRQLKPGGRLIAPVGRSESQQELMLITKNADGETTRQSIMPVRFMRLPGGERI